MLWPREGIPNADTNFIITAADKSIFAKLMKPRKKDNEPKNAS